MQLLGLPAEAEPWSSRHFPPLRRRLAPKFRPSPIYKQLIQLCCVHVVQLIIHVKYSVNCTQSSAYEVVLVTGTYSQTIFYSVSFFFLVELSPIFFNYIVPTISGFRLVLFLVIKLPAVEKLRSDAAEVAEIYRYLLANRLSRGKACCCIFSGRCKRMRFPFLRATTVTGGQLHGSCSGWNSNMISDV